MSSARSGRTATAPPAVVRSLGGRMEPMGILILIGWVVSTASCGTQAPPSVPTPEGSHEADNDVTGDDDTASGGDDDVEDDDTGGFDVPYEVTLVATVRGKKYTYGGAFGTWHLEHVAPGDTDICAEAWWIGSTPAVSEGLEVPSWVISLPFPSRPANDVSADLSVSFEGFEEVYSDDYEYWLYTHFRDDSGRTIGWFGGTATVTALSPADIVLSFADGETCVIDVSLLGLDGSLSECLNDDMEVTLSETRGRMIESLLEWEDELPLVSSGNTTGAGWCVW